MSLVSDIAAFHDRVNTRIRVKTAEHSIKRPDVADSLDELADMLIELLPDSILSGLTVTINGANTVTTAGTWKIGGVIYSTGSSTTIPYDPQDATLDRYDVLYADTNNTINLLSGDLAITPVEPQVPTGTLKVATILITPTVVTIITPPTTGFVDLLTDQIIDGFKTFLKSPQVPLAVGDNDAVPLIQLNDIGLFDEIIDDEPDFNPVAGNYDFVLNIFNGGDNDILYHDQNGDPQVLVPGQSFAYGYLNSDQASVPDITLDDNTLFAFQAPPIPQGDFDYQSATDFAGTIAALNAAAAADYITGNGDIINIYNKNLIVGVPDDAVRAELTQLVIYNVTDSTVVYDVLTDPSSPLLYLGSDLDPAKTYQARIQSTDATIVIAVTAHNISGTLLKSQNFLQSDSDNSLISPITVLIYKTP